MLIDYLPWLVGAVEWTGSIEGNKKDHHDIKMHNAFYSKLNEFIDS